MVKKTQRKKDLELLKKACPAVFSKLPPPEVKQPRYVSFQVPPEVFGAVRHWLDLGFHLEVVTGTKTNHCQIYILNTEAVKEYNKGRDPTKGYSKE